MSDANAAQNQQPMRVDATLSEWEEMMVDDLCKQYNLPDDVVLNIGVTFLLNELQGSANGKPSILNSMHASMSEMQSRKEAAADVQSGDTESE